jgi:hypothetical protein
MTEEGWQDFGEGLGGLGLGAVRRFPRLTDILAHTCGFALLKRKFFSLFSALRSSAIHLRAK